MFDKKPCPHCATPYPWVVRELPVRWIFPRYYVECWRCHYCGKTKIGRKAAIKAWNKIQRFGNGK